jgi:myo-inositol-1(or 4)-monophosphatase
MAIPDPSGPESPPNPESPSGPDSVDAVALAELAERAARKAGALLRDGHDRRRTQVQTKSSSTDMVSEMDTASERLIRELILTARPGDAILGEEGGEQAGTPPTEATSSGRSEAVRWIVDPLDGTTNYLYGFPAWSVSVAAQVQGVTVAGVVYDPDRDELFRAVRRRGAQLNGRPLAVRTGATLATALIATGFAYDRDRRAVQGREVAHVVARVRDIRRAGSAALDLCWVGAGRLDAYYEQTTQIWDWAAGALVAAEAGAWVGGLDGGSPASDGIMAASPLLAEPLRLLLAEAAALAADGPRSRT